MYRCRPIGRGRYLEALVLAVWIAGWCVGEIAALTLFGALLAVVIGSVAGLTPSFASRLAPDGSAPFFLLGVTLWLTVWTIGGVAAVTRLLRSLAGEDLVSVTPAGLEIERRAGPFRRRGTIPRDTILRVRLRLHGATLVVDTASGTVDVTTFGTPDDREALRAWLRQRLELPDEAEARRREAETDPPGWEVEGHGDETRLARPRRTAAMQSAILWSVAGLISLGVVSTRAADRSTSAPLAAAALGLLIGLWAAWTTWGRSEWVVSRGRLIRRWRLGDWRQEQPFDSAALELVQRVDPDGDDRFTLSIRSATAQRTIATALHDPAELASLAQWLSARTGFPIERV